MRWLVDECVHGSLVTELRGAGHDVLYAAESLQKTADLNLAEIAQSTGRLVITEDRDFGQIVFQAKKSVPGIVYLRIGLRDRAQRWPKLKLLIEQFGERLYGHYVVIDGRQVRVRLLPEP